MDNPSWSRSWGTNSDGSTLHRCVHCGLEQEVPSAALAARGFVRCANRDCQRAPWDPLDVSEEVALARLRQSWSASSAILLELESLPFGDERRELIPRVSARALALGEALLSRNAL
jgi:hypothetical protein